MRRFQTIFAFTLTALVPTFGMAQRPPLASSPSTRLRNGRNDLQTRFTEAQRSQIARELLQNALRAGDDARKAAPVTAVRGTKTAADQENHQTHLSILFKRRYDRQTCARYKLTHDDIVAISREAIDANLKHR